MVSVFRVDCNRNNVNTFASVQKRHHPQKRKKNMYIEKIKSPADLKKLDIEALNTVANETREAVLNRVSKHGGHIGPNLGFVEATVALHYVFDAPTDKFVFDVSHQCYPHKVLTGRAAGFLGDADEMNAISGYSSPTESPVYDNFEVATHPPPSVSQRVCRKHATSKAPTKTSSPSSATVLFLAAKRLKDSTKRRNSAQVSSSL